MIWLVLTACSSDPAGKAPIVTSDADLPPTPPTTPTTSPPPETDGPADAVIVKAAVVTLDGASNRFEAFAIRGGEIVWVGVEPVPELWIGPTTKVVDLEGATVLPGLFDVHNHILEAFHPAGGTCIVDGYGMLSSHLSTLENCQDDQVGSDWVVGWGFDLWSALSSPGSPAGLMDSVIPDRPAVMMEASSHAAWVNTLALEALGYDATTPDPPGGVILREADGTPTGLLMDAASEAAFDLALANNAEMPALNEEALRAGLAEANRNGLTGIGDGRCYWKRGYVEAWHAVADAGELTVRANVPLWAYPNEDDDSQLATLKAYYDVAPDAKLRFGQVKMYVDGLVWITTGALLEPYTDNAITDPLGLNYFDPLRLKRYVSELEEAGFDVQLHGIGDRGVREGLDAIEAARVEHGELGRRHRITHVEFVDPEDIPRFAELNVTADIQLAGWWTEPEFLHDSDRVVGAERVNTLNYRVRDLHEAGARITLSSDYDVASMSPFVGIARAVDRGDQSLPDVESALRAMTTDAAWLLGFDDIAGSIEVGKRADFVVVDRDPFSTETLAETVVLWTVFDGDEVFRDAGFVPAGW